MAVSAVGVTLGASLGEGKYNSRAAPANADPAAAVAAVGAAEIPVAAAVAVLVADGASPTQAHVNTLNSAHTTLAAAIAAAATAAPGTANLTVSVDLAVVTTRNALRAALRAAREFFDSAGLPT